MSIYLGNTKIFNPQTIRGGDIEKENLYINQQISTYTDTKVTKVRSYAFYNRHSLQSVDLPNVSSIGNNAFNRCTSLIDVSIPNYSFTSSIFSSSPLANLQIGNTKLTSDLISELTYFVNTLQRIDFAKATTIPDGYCQNWLLKEIKGSRITSIGLNGILDCSQLISISFPMVSYIGDGAFARCYSLSAADLPMAEYIGTNAFLDDSVITSLNLPRASHIGDGAFARCYSLSTINLPMAEYIGNNAFVHDSAITSLNVLRVSYIGNAAFANCYNLLSVYLTGSSICSLANTGAFDQTPISNYTASTGGRYGSIYVPASLYNNYKTATNWTVYSSRFVSI